MAMTTAIDLGENIKKILVGMPKNVINFTLSLEDKSRNDPAGYIQDVNNNVNSIKGFEIFYVQSSAAFPGQYDFFIRRERKELKSNA